MNKTYITSDLHFSHRNIINFCPVSRARYKNDIDYMNATMLVEWNNIVDPEDIVYILGDVAFCNAEQAVKFMRSLNGHKILIEGNHDRKLLKDKNFRDCFEEIHVYHEISVNGVTACLFHYPIAEWNGCHRGNVHFHGHLHGLPSGIEQYRALDAGMDATGEIVVELNEMIRRALKKPAKGHGNSKESM